MIYFDFDGVLFNAISRALKQWEDLGWFVGSYEDWTHWNKYQDWGLPAFRPFSQEHLFYDDPDGEFAYSDMLGLLQDCVREGRPVTILSHCSAPGFSDWKKKWLRDQGLGDVPFIAVSSPEEKLKHCSSNTDVLIDDLSSTVNNWEGVGLLVKRPWSGEGGLTFDDIRDALAVVSGPQKGTGESVLEEALKLVRGDRQNQYGPPDQDFTRTAEMWNTLFGGRGDGQPFRAQDVATAMICIKLSRQTHMNKRDNWVDLAGYAHCGNICMELEK